MHMGHFSGGYKSYKAVSQTVALDFLFHTHKAFLFFFFNLMPRFQNLEILPEILNFFNIPLKS